MRDPAVSLLLVVAAFAYLSTSPAQLHQHRVRLTRAVRGLTRALRGFHRRKGRPLA